MNLLGIKIGSVVMLVSGLLANGVASATPITMNFDGLTSGASVHAFYNGGCSRKFGSRADCHGPVDGVVWKGLTIRHSAGAPSPFGYAGFLARDSATMNVAAGFDGGLSFAYYNNSDAVFYGGVSVYSGLNGHGKQLLSSDINPTSGWDFLELAFSGTARSVIFRGSPLFATAFDDVTIGVNASVNPVPEPGALGAFGFGMLVIGVLAGLRRRYS